MQRIITIQGTVVSKDSNWFGSLNDGIQRNAAVDALNNSGWSVFSLDVSRSIVGSIEHLGYVKYDITIQIVSLPNDNPTRILQGVTSSLFSVFNSVSLYVAGDDSLNNGVFNPTYNTDNASYQSILDAINANTAKKAIENAGLGLGLSTPVVIGVGLLLIVLYLKG
jgi:hypothetical protein